MIEMLADIWWKKEVIEASKTSWKKISDFKGISARLSQWRTLVSDDEEDTVLIIPMEDVITSVILFFILSIAKLSLAHGQKYRALTSNDLLI